MWIFWAILCTPECGRSCERKASSEVWYTMSGIIHRLNSKHLEWNRQVLFHSISTNIYTHVHITVTLLLLSRISHRTKQHSAFAKHLLPFANLLNVFSRTKEMHSWAVSLSETGRPTSRSSSCITTSVQYSIHRQRQWKMSLNKY